jgi:hypothetical protein
MFGRRYNNPHIVIIILGFVLTQSSIAQAGQASATLVVNVSAFNYSNGYSSDEYNVYARTQGGELGQPSCTRHRAGVARHYMFLFPNTPVLRKKLRRELEEMAAAEKMLGDPVPRVHSDPKEALSDGYFGRFQLSEGKTIIKGLPPGEYYVLPAVKFPNGRGEWQYGYSIPNYFDKRIDKVVEVFSLKTGTYVKKRLTLNPVVWCPKEIELVAGRVTTISISPHAYNLASGGINGADSFIKEVILGE